MKTHEVIATVEEGVRNQRVSPHLAAFIASFMDGADLDDYYVDQVGTLEHGVNAPTPILSVSHAGEAAHYAIN